MANVYKVVAALLNINSICLEVFQFLLYLIQALHWVSGCTQFRFVIPVPCKDCLRGLLLRQRIHPVLKHGFLNELVVTVVFSWLWCLCYWTLDVWFKLWSAQVMGTSLGLCRFSELDVLLKLFKFVVKSWCIVQVLRVAQVVNVWILMDRWQAGAGYCWLVEPAILWWVHLNGENLKWFSLLRLLFELELAIFVFHILEVVSNAVWKELRKYYSLHRRCLPRILTRMPIAISSGIMRSWTV